MNRDSVFDARKFFNAAADNFVDKYRISLVTKVTLVKNLTTTWKLVGDGLQLGASIVFAIFIGAALGWWLDGKFGTSYLKFVFFRIWSRSRGPKRLDRDPEAVAKR